MKQKLLYGVGINDADYTVKVLETVGRVNGKQKQKLLWMCPFYRVWTNMLTRVYSKAYKKGRATYDKVSICEEWHLFSTFKAWMETQDWEGKQLDKDILSPGNKVYSLETCVFVSRQVNMFVLEADASRGEYMIGVNWNKQNSKFLARCSNPITKKVEYLGYFNCELEAHRAWLKCKLAFAGELAATETDERVAKALVDRYANYKQES